jgi:aromatic amino acid transport protein AroP
MISLVHMKFRQHKCHAGQVTRFASVGYPFTNYLCLAFLAAILIVMYRTPELRISVYLIPVWLAVLAVSYYLRQGKARLAMPEAASRQ